MGTSGLVKMFISELPGLIDDCLKQIIFIKRNLCIIIHYYNLFLLRCNAILTVYFYFQVLRFSRLFGPGKPSSMPQIWRSVRKRKKRRKHHHSSHQQQSDSGSDTETYRQKKVGWVLQFGSPPPLDKCKSDDEVSWQAL